MTCAATTITLTDEQRSKYRDDGFIIIRNTFSKDRMEALKSQAKAIVEAGRADASDGVPVFYLPNMPKPFLDFCREPKILAILRQLLGPRVEFLSVKPVFKDASVTYPSAWHQDHAYWGGSNKVSVWFALDDAAIENGCLRFVPNAHGELIDHHSREGVFASFLEEDQLDLSSVVDAEMVAGDACFFHDLAPHASYGNVSGKDRWSLIPTYRNADITDTSAVWQSSLHL